MRRHLIRDTILKPSALLIDKDYFLSKEGDLMSKHFCLLTCSLAEIFGRVMLLYAHQSLIWLIKFNARALSPLLLRWSPLLFKWF